MENSALFRNSSIALVVLSDPYITSVFSDVEIPLAPEEANTIDIILTIRYVVILYESKIYHYQHIAYFMYPHPHHVICIIEFTMTFYDLIAESISLGYLLGYFGMPLGFAIINKI
jgi:hypothetical protein